MKWTAGVAKRYTERRIKKIMESLDICQGHWQDIDTYFEGELNEIKNRLEILIEDLQEMKEEEKGRDEIRQPGPKYKTSHQDGNRKLDHKIKEALSQVYSLAKKTTIIKDPSMAVIKLAGMIHLEIEIFSCIFVDNKNRIIATEEMSRGTVDQAPVFPREIIKRALMLNASGIILGHNHPGGDPEPSWQDKELTQKIRRLCVEMGIRILDHVILSEAGHYSFQEHGLL